MLKQPKLKSNHNPDKNKGHAKFLMGLNNRVEKLDRRIDQLETHQQHILKHQVGYRELALTLCLALLMFTSVVLAIRELSPQDHSKLTDRLSAHIDKLKGSEKQSALNLLANIEPSFKGWLNTLMNTPQTKNTPYQWPLKTNSQANYSEHKQGINIKGKLGDPVYAIEDGTIIYSDSELSDYGNLILVQHDDNVISVYANNYSNYVKRHETVKKGQLIAALGEGEGQIPQLYFEIRYKGKAQDPFLYFQ